MYFRQGGRFVEVRFSRMTRVNVEKKEYASCHILDNGTIIRFNLKS
jgi:hypothetical protein